MDAAVKTTEVHLGAVLGRRPRGCHVRDVPAGLNFMAIRQGTDDRDGDREVKVLSELKTAGRLLATRRILFLCSRITESP